MKVRFYGHDVISQDSADRNVVLEVRLTRVGEHVPLAERWRILNLVRSSAEPWRAATATFFNGIYAAYIPPQLYNHAFIEYGYQSQDDEVYIEVDRAYFSYFSFLPAVLLCYDDSVELMFRLEYPTT